MHFYRATARQREEASVHLKIRCPCNGSDPPYQDSQDAAEEQMRRIIDIEQLSHAPPGSPFPIIQTQKRNRQTGSKLNDCIYAVNKYKIYDCIKECPDHHGCHLLFEISSVCPDKYNCHSGNAAPV